MARTLVNGVMADEGWQAMTMLDWEEGRDYELAPGKRVHIVPVDVPVAIDASLRADGPKRTGENSTIESKQFFESLEAWQRCSE
jgi:hypothetical protein